MNGVPSSLALALLLILEAAWLLCFIPRRRLLGYSSHARVAEGAATRHYDVLAGDEDRIAGASLGQRGEAINYSSATRLPVEKPVLKPVAQHAAQGDGRIDGCIGSRAASSSVYQAVSQAVYQTSLAAQSREQNVRAERETSASCSSPAVSAAEMAPPDHATAATAKGRKKVAPQEQGFLARLQAGARAGAALTQAVVEASASSAQDMAEKGESGADGSSARGANPLYLNARRNLRTVSRNYTPMPASEVAAAAAAAGTEQQQQQQQLPTPSPLPPPEVDRSPLPPMPHRSQSSGLPRSPKAPQVRSVGLVGSPSSTAGAAEGVDEFSTERATGGGAVGGGAQPSMPTIREEPERVRPSYAPAGIPHGGLVYQISAPDPPPSPPPPAGPLPLPGGRMLVVSSPHALPPAPFWMPPVPTTSLFISHAQWAPGVPAFASYGFRVEQQPHFAELAMITASTGQSVALDGGGGVDDQRAANESRLDGIMGMLFVFAVCFLAMLSSPIEVIVPLFAQDSPPTPPTPPMPPSPPPSPMSPPPVAFDCLAVSNLSQPQATVVSVVAVLLMLVAFAALLRLAARVHAALEEMDPHELGEALWRYFHRAMSPQNRPNRHGRGAGGMPASITVSAADEDGQATTAHSPPRVPKLAIPSRLSLSRKQSRLAISGSEEAADLDLRAAARSHPATAAAPPGGEGGTHQDFNVEEDPSLLDA